MTESRLDIRRRRERGNERTDALPRTADVTYPETSLPGRPVRRPWTLAFFGVLAAAGLWALPVFGARALCEADAGWAEFAGRFHLLLLHVPIGIAALVLFQELGAVFFPGYEEPRRAVLFPMFALCVSAILAALSGFLLFHGGGYCENPLLQRHLWGGVTFAALATLAFVARAWTAEPGCNPAFFRLLLFLACGVLIFTGHSGASLSHGPGFLTERLPDGLRSKLGMEPAPVPTAEKTAAAAETAPAVPDPLRAAVQALADEFPGAVAFDSDDPTAVVVNAGPQRPVFDDAVLAKFAAVMPSIVSLDLTGTRITDQGLAHLENAGKLRALRLGETAVTDEAAEILRGLSSLESLGLQATRITDAGIARLDSLGSLRRLYLWWTAVTPEGAAALREKLPELEIMTNR